MRIAVISKPSKPELNQVMPELVSWLEKRKYEVILDQESVSYAPGRKFTNRSEIAALKPEFVIVLGGDGTLLAAARVVAKAGIPILGVNLGSLGFLTEVALSEIYTALESVEKKQILRESRSMIDCRVLRRGEQVNTFIALNDVVVTKSAIARMTEVDIKINGEFVANYKADGVIVSTPTGSTAYSLAAGGPILEPSVDAFVVTPVSPHALTNRPLVVRDIAEISILVRGNLEETYLTVDGQTGMNVLNGDEILCKKSEHQVQLLRARGRTIFDVLRTKLKWGER
jgi:NAD+ kinase